MKKAGVIICLFFCSIANAQKVNYVLVHKSLVKKKLQEWLNSYAHLSLDDFKYCSISKDTLGRSSIDTLDKETRYLYGGFLRYSPNKQLVIDLLSGHCVLERKGKRIVDEGCDHGGYIYIWDRANNIQYAIADMSSCAYYEEGCWLSNTIFILTQIEYSGNCTSTKLIKASIYVFDIKHHKRTCYNTGARMYKKRRDYLAFLYKKAHIAM